MVMTSRIIDDNNNNDNKKKIEMAKMKILFITCLRVTGISQPIMFLVVHVTRGYHHGRNEPMQLICSLSYICSPIVVF